MEEQIIPSPINRRGLICLHGVYEGVVIQNTAPQPCQQSCHTPLGEAPGCGWEVSPHGRANHPITDKPEGPDLTFHGVLNRYILT